MKYGAVIVETRPIENLVSIIESHMKFLPGWDLTIYYGTDNEEMLREAFPFAKFNDLVIELKPVSYCNDVMTSLRFWESIPYDKVLMFQSDSGILREGIEEFLEWDYVGSPWGHLGMGGNGGLSLRTKQSMIDLLNKRPFDSKNLNEDEYYSLFLHEVGGKVAPREVCFRFGVESIYQLGTFGYHAIDKHLTPDECDRIKSQYK